MRAPAHTSSPPPPPPGATEHPLLRPAAGFFTTIRNEKWYDASEARLLQLLQSGPVSIGIETKNAAFGNYRSGVFDIECPFSQPDHAVVAVGYGVDPDGTLFWKARGPVRALPAAAGCRQSDAAAARRGGG